MTFVNNLWRNEKSREIIIQLLVLLSIGWFLSWLVANVDANFKALGKDISFDQDGWRISYSQIQDLLPRKIRLQKEDLILTLLIKSWVAPL